MAGVAFREFTLGAASGHDATHQFAIAASPAQGVSPLFRGILPQGLPAACPAGDS